MGHQAHLVRLPHVMERLWADAQADYRARLLESLLERCWVGCDHGAWTEEPGGASTSPGGAGSLTSDPRHAHFNAVAGGRSRGGRLQSSR